jgi:hypothetical protein
MLYGVLVQSSGERILASRITSSPSSGASSPRVH